MTSPTYLPGVITEEQKRMEDGRPLEVCRSNFQRDFNITDHTDDWMQWGPYLSERQWGTVREDYSPEGNAWDYFSFDHAHSRAYRWGEDGIAGLCDDHSYLCLSVVLWNGKDPILKERLFGLSNGEGNHGEDVKELYYYLDGTPSNSYLKYLYKYPQAEFPYEKLRQENARRGLEDPEYEITDTGVFDDDRYFDVTVEYAKAEVDDIIMKITVKNHGPDEAEIVVMPQLWFHNVWTWHQESDKPEMKLSEGGKVEATHSKLGDYEFCFDSDQEALFTENNTNSCTHHDICKVEGFYKDAFHDYLIHGNQKAVNPAQTGTKAGIVHRLKLQPGETRSVIVRLAERGRSCSLADGEEILRKRKEEADQYYNHLQQGITGEDERLVQRQAFAGMIWTKQYYDYDVSEWLEGDDGQPSPPAGRQNGRNSDWQHLNNNDIISMPDKWEYPWFAAWDLAFHCIPLAVIDPVFAKNQLDLLTREWYMHPNGQMPAYEWAFGDVNPPVHGWATWRVFQIDRAQRQDLGDKKYPGDLEFLERVFHKLMLNFTWWVNRKDPEGRNIFQGGFLGLDNIGIFDRSKPLPTGGYINQSDGTSWVAMFSLNLMRIALELAKHNRVYEDIATKFFQHFLNIAEAMTNIADEGIGLWDEKDEFYYDVLNLPNHDGGFHRIPIKLRSLVGLIPLFAVETIEPETLERLPEFAKRLKWVMKNKPHLADLVSRWQETGRGSRRLLSLLRGHRMKKLLGRMLDETEFLSDYGIRGMSKAHQDPFIFEHDGERYEVEYSPAESTTHLFGGNSNWRGPVWMPVNYLLIESLQKFHHYYGDDFKVECPTGSGNYMTILEVTEELERRLTRIFLKDESGKRPVFGHEKILHDHPEFSKYVLFYEYFHGDNGRGVGASHQTGWSGLVAKLLYPRRKLID